MDKIIKEKMKKPKAELLKYVFLNNVSVKTANEEFMPLLRAYVNSVKEEERKRVAVDAYDSGYADGIRDYTGQDLPKQ